MPDAPLYCGFCGSHDCHPLYPTYDIFSDHYTICRCGKCHVHFLWPYPDQHKLDNAYDDSYYGTRDTKFLPVVEKVIDYFRFRRSVKLKRHMPSNGKILDIGCGNGRFLRYLSKFGNYQLYGIELEGNSARRAATIPDINLTIGPVESSSFAPATFDAITLFHVFDHVTNPRMTLEIIANIIKPGGMLIMSFPNIDSFQAKLFKGRWLHLDPPRHIFLFAPKDFIKHMQQLGFELQRERYHSTEQNPYGMIQSILNSLQKRREVLFERFKGNKQYAPEYSQFSIALQFAFFFFMFPVFMFTDLFESLFHKGATVEFTFIRKEHGASPPPSSPR